MKLTPAILGSCYALLRETEPFCRWHLPPSEDVWFVVMPGRFRYADFTPLKRLRIRVWEGKHGRVSRVLETMAHEMVHLKMHSCKATKHKAAHGAAFKKLAQQVCRHHPDFEYPVF